MSRIFADDAHILVSQTILLYSIMFILSSSLFWNISEACEMLSSYRSDLAGVLLLQ